MMKKSEINKEEVFDRIVESFRVKLRAILDTVPELDEIIKENQSDDFIEDCVKKDLINSNDPGILTTLDNHEKYYYLINRMTEENQIESKIRHLFKETKDKLQELVRKD